MIRIVIADDHRIVSEGLCGLLERAPLMSVVAVAENGREAVRLALEHRADLVIMDVAMPELNGMDATRQILAAAPTTKVIALSMHADRRYVAGMLEAGVSGYLLKHSAFEELVVAIEAVRRGQVYLSPGVSDVIVSEFVRRGGPPEPGGAGPTTAAAALTAREREVTQLLAEGLSAREVADRLFLSVKTVETHRRRIYEKIGARSLADLTKFAIREGVTTLEH